MRIRTILRRRLQRLSNPLLCLTLSLSIGWSETAWAESSGSTPEATQEVAAESEQQPTLEWLLKDFEWGKSPKIVDTAVKGHPGYNCHALMGKQLVRGSCAGVTAQLAGQRFLVKFGYHEGLSKVRLLTPDVAIGQKGRLEVAWKHLTEQAIAAYGPVAESRAFPDLSTLSPGPPVVTHLWKRSDREVRIGVGRRPERPLYFVVGAVLDPERERKAKAEASAAP